jgi:hypothetical protein
MCMSPAISARFSVAGNSHEQPCLPSAAGLAPKPRLPGRAGRSRRRTLQPTASQRKAGHEPATGSTPRPARSSAGGMGEALPAFEQAAAGSERLRYLRRHRQRHVPRQRGPRTSRVARQGQDQSAQVAETIDRQWRAGCVPVRARRTCRGSSSGERRPGPPRPSGPMSRPPWAGGGALQAASGRTVGLDHRACRLCPRAGVSRTVPSGVVRCNRTQGSANRWSRARLRALRFA